ncbi:DNA clamp loader [Cryptococcus gattii NT-10]|nr:DNA clamp loader [Cryptococcus gattii NT-10]
MNFRYWCLKGNIGPMIDWMDFDMTDRESRFSPPSTRPVTRRQVLTRSRSTSYNMSSLGMTTRRTSTLSASSSVPNIRSPPGSLIGDGHGVGLGITIPSRSRTTGTGMLLRTQSTPMLSTASHASFKAVVAAAGSGGCVGNPEKDCFDRKRLGRGKENIPPKKDQENDDNAPRKRLRMTSRGSFSDASGRRRSGSVVSIRSETSAPSTSSSSISSWGTGRFPSPSPSDASYGTSIPDPPTPCRALGMLPSSSEVPETPTKSRVNQASCLLTPPPSSPDLATEGAADFKPTREANPYKRLKAALRLSTISGFTDNEVIIGREQEKAVVSQYLIDEKNDKDVGMYVSGPPGTGKTALVTAFGRQKAEQGWRVVEVGCMGLKISDVWPRLGDELGCGKTEEGVTEFVKLNASRILIILDEVDSLMPPAPSTAPPATSHLFAKLFSLPFGSSNTKLIAISNTLDLTVRARLALPNGLQPSVLPFKAYGAPEMSNIVNARIANANVRDIKIDSTTMTLLGRKVEAQNGDLRMCLGVLGSAISLAEAEWIKRRSQAANDPSKQVPMIKVAIPHLMKALTSYTAQLRASAGSSAGSTSAAGKKIKSVQLQGKMVLVAILVYLARSRADMNGCPALGPSASPPGATATGSDIPAAALYTTYSHLLSHSSSPFPPAAESDYQDLLSNLETLGLVSLPFGSGKGTNTSANKVVLCVREEEVKEGMGLMEGQDKGVAEEEVKHVWEREEAKIQRVKQRLELVSNHDH